MKISDDAIKLKKTQGFFKEREHEWWTVRSSDHVDSGKLEASSGVPDALIEGVEWPSSSRHSVVLVALQNDQAFPAFEKTFFDPNVAQSSDVSQTVSVFNGTRFASYQIGTNVYHVGTLGFWIRMGLLFSQYPWLIVIGAALFCFLMAALLRALLRRHARNRLQPVE